MTAEPSRRINVVLFDGFELLDVFGPLQMFGVLSPDCFEIVILGPHAGPVRSAQGPQAHADCAYEDAREPDIVFVPGGMGTRTLVKDGAFLTWLAGHADPAEFVMSVCTGSAVLAAAGLLDGYRATSNKRSSAGSRNRESPSSGCPSHRRMKPSEPTPQNRGHIRVSMRPRAVQAVA